MDPNPLDADACYRAIVSRDPRFDGHFFTAVATTRIYCRPVCRARTPRRTSCAFFRTAAGAERAGYRPCLRCRPELAPGRIDFDATLAESIFARLQTGALDERSIESLAADIGLSSRQIRRIVVDRFGVTPIEIAQTHRLLFAKKLLHETALSMTDLAHAAGFRSVRRFNATFRDRYGLAPSSLRRTVRNDAGARDGDAGQPSTGGIVLRLSYRPPFEWSTIAGFLAFRATSGVERVDLRSSAPVYHRAVAFDRGPSAAPLHGWIAVTRPAVGLDALVVTVAPTLLPMLMQTTVRLRELFDLDADPLRIDAHLGSDPLLAAAVATRPGMRVPGAWDRFELALRAVLGQQVSVAGASTLAARLAQRFGAPVDTPFPGVERAAPTAAVLAEADVGEIAAVGMPAARARTIRALARYALDGGLRPPPGTPRDDVVARLDAIPGVGPWTANYIAMRALRDPDAFPAGDLGLRKAVMQLERSDAMPTEAALRARAERWRPWRAYAATTLWQGLAAAPDATLLP